MHMLCFSYIFGSIFSLKLHEIFSLQLPEYSINSSTLIHYRIKCRNIGIVDSCRVDLISSLKNYSLRMQKDLSTFSSATKVHIYKGNYREKNYLRNFPNATIYTGTVDKYRRSRVFGYFYKNMFIGKMNIRNQAFYIEPAYYHIRIKRKYRKGIMYRLDKVNIDYKYVDRRMDYVNKRDELFTQTNHIKKCYRNSSVNSMKEAVSIQPQWTCSLELLADHTYVKDIHDINRTIAEMIFYTMNANLVFRNIDLDEDGLKDGIGFTVEKITILQTEDGISSENISNKSEFLYHLSKYRHPYCMLMCFSSRDFWSMSEYTIGDVKKIGGICPNDIKFSKESNNIGYVTNIERNYKLPRYVIASNLLHQLGHAFGCQDDPVNDKICSPGDIEEKLGNYIMHPNIPFGAHRNNWKFSSCCLKVMNDFVKTKDTCLNRAKKSNCGNEIVEEGEECDSGYSSRICDKDICCKPKGSRFQCSLETNKRCSPRNAECCNEFCNFISSEENKTCFSNEPCYNASSVCNGITPFCPGKREPNGVICFGSSRTCLDGKCISNICIDNGLEVCQCSSIEEECHICCRNHSDICRSAKSLNFFPSKYQFYLKIEGSNCDDNNGICTSDGICVRETGYRRYYKVKLWYYGIPIAIILAVIITVLIFPSFSQKKKNVLLR